MTKRSLVVACALVFGLSAIAAALASGQGAPASRVDVVERDFQIRVSTAHVAAGPVVFRVDNRGPDAHELIVVRDPAGLPFRRDGITIDEERLTKQIAGALEPGRAGDDRELRVVLRPGRYVLLCNMYGHYMGGMHAVVVAR